MQLAHGMDDSSHRRTDDPSSHCIPKILQNQRYIFLVHESVSINQVPTNSFVLILFGGAGGMQPRLSQNSPAHKFDKDISVHHKKAEYFFQKSALNSLK